MSESQLLNDIIRALYPWVHLHRANVGCVRTETGRWFSTGLPKGFPDLHGTLPVSVTGYDKAVPVFIECKTGRNKPSPEQAAFIGEELEKGSIAGVCYSVEDALALITPHIRKVEDGKETV